MADNTTRYGLPFPEGGDDISLGDDKIKELAEKLNLTFAGTDKGLLAARPTSTAGSPGIAGRFYIVTDDGAYPLGRLDLDYGTGWLTVSPPVAAAPGSAYSERDFIVGATITTTLTRSELPPMRVSVGAGEHLYLARLAGRIEAGTSVGIKLRRYAASGGSAFADIAGFGTTASPKLITPAGGLGNVWTPDEVELGDGDLLWPEIVSATGSPQGMTVGAIFRRVPA